MRYKLAMLLSLLLLTAPLSGQTYFTGGKSVGTEAVRVGTVSVSFSSETGSCGGTLIDDDIVITAAHCFVWKNGTATDGEFSIHLKKRWKTVRIDRVRPHPNYVAADPGKSGAGFDVALIRLKRKILFPKSVKAFALGDTQEFAPKKATLFGYETDFSSVNYDQKRNLDVIVRSIKEGKMLSVPRIPNLQDYYFCSGDSGSPLVVSQDGGKPSLVVGVASFINKSQSLTGPGVDRAKSPCSDSIATSFTDLRYSSAWIQSTLKSFRDLPPSKRPAIEIESDQL